MGEVQVRLALVVVVGLGVVAAPASAETVTFKATSDTFVSSARPGKNYGRSRLLRVDRTPRMRSYLRFNVRLPRGARVERVSLLVYARSRRGSRGFFVSRLSRRRWRERRMTYRRRPAFRSRLGRARGWSRRGWKRVSLPPHVLKSGNNTFGLATNSRRAKSFGSRQSRRKPRLVVRYSGGAATASPRDILVPASGAWFGAYHKAASWSTGELARWEGLVGAKARIDHRFVSWGTTWWPNSWEPWDNQNGRHPMLSIGGNTEFPGLDAVINGSQDAWIGGRADAIRALGFKLFLRPLWEMNGDWAMPWQGKANNSPGTTDGPAKYVAAWRRIVDIFRQRGATNAIWVWAPNCISSPKEGWNSYANYYPGDGYADWVACDGYNEGGSDWRSWSHVFGNSWEGRPSVYAAYPQKPFMVSETGSCESGGDKAAWITQARNDIKAHFPNLKALVWFDMDKECDWRAESSLGALSALRALAADPYFNP
jgi:hypothetical protein